jgi:OmpA-OmpF porin, OOP family
MNYNPIVSRIFAVALTIGFITGFENVVAQASAAGFDFGNVRVANPRLGNFPYFSLIDGYQPSKDTFSGNVDAAFDRYEFFDGTRIVTVEGRLKTIAARGKGASALEIFKTYETLVRDMGGVLVFVGKSKAMSDRKVKFGDLRHRSGNRDEMAVFVVRTPDKEIWVEAYVIPYGPNPQNYFLTVVEKKTLNARASGLTAAEMENELSAKGHVALYLNFDFDKADIKPNSRPIIDEITTLLKQNPSLNLTVEGHTDNVGKPDYNKRLSDARAKSVVMALTRNGIEARRLKAVGSGSDKPIKANDTDEGRAKNRRVELVRM